MRRIEPEGRARRVPKRLAALLLAALTAFAGCRARRDGPSARAEEGPGAASAPAGRLVQPGSGTVGPGRSTGVTPSRVNPATPVGRIVASARAQALRGAAYAPGYVGLTYPGGDLPPDRGVCTDVVVRALRAAGYDLQVLIHEDMGSRFDEYPRLWGLTRPDRNIDHRRVPNQMCFFARHGVALPLAYDTRTAAAWQPGDLVYWRLPSGLLHCGVLVDEVNEEGVPLVVHNLERCRLEDCLLAYAIIGHFRYGTGK